MRRRAEESVTMQMVAPAVRIWQASGEWPARIAAALGAAAQAVWGDFFLFALGGLLISHFYDWIYGRQTAKYHGEFDDLKSRIGLNTKLASFVIVLLVRWLEAGLTRFPQVSIETGGIFAAAGALLLIMQDVRSIEAKRIRNGAGPIPFLSRSLDLMEKMVGGALEKVLPGTEDGADDQGP